MGLLDMCCPKKPKKSLDYIIKWVENADKRFEDIDTYLENLNAAINGDNGLYSRVSGLEVALGEKQDTLTFDTTPIINSTNPVTSGGVKAALDGKANSSHVHNVSDISGLPFSGLHFFVMDSIYDDVDMDKLFTPEGFQTMVSGRKTVIVQNSTSSIVDLGAFFISQTSVPVHTNQDLPSTTIEVGGYALCTIYLVDKLESIHEHTDYDFCYFVVLEQVFTD